MPTITKESQIKRIKEKLMDCYECEKGKETIFITLIEELAWQIFTLQDCREKIKTDGFMVLFTQGKQEMWIVNPLQKVYDQTVKNINITIKSLESIGTKSNKNKSAANGSGPLGEFGEFLKSVREAKG